MTQSDIQMISARGQVQSQGFAPDPHKGASHFISL